MSEEVKYVYYESPKDELVRDLKTDGDDMAVELETWNGSEWVNYYGSPTDLVKIEEEEAKRMMEKETDGRAYPPGFIPYGKAKPIIDRDEVWVH